MPQPNGSYLTRKDILAANDLSYEEVDCPEWGGVVRVRELTAGEALDLGSATLRGDGNITPDDFKKVAAMVIVDSEGKAQFKEGDITLLGRKSLAPIRRIVETTLRISALTVEGEEETGKDSSSTTDDASLSD